MTDKQKEWIDKASYKMLLGRWRFASIGDPMFIGDTGQYYKKVMSEKKKDANHVQASKDLGWEK